MTLATLERTATQKFTSPKAISTELTLQLHGEEGEEYVIGRLYSVNAIPLLPAGATEIDRQWSGHCLRFSAPPAILCSLYEQALAKTSNLALSNLLDVRRSSKTLYLYAQSLTESGAFATEDTPDSGSDLLPTPDCFLPTEDNTGSDNGDPNSEAFANESLTKAQLLEILDTLIFDRHLSRKEVGITSKSNKDAIQKAIALLQ